MESTTTTLAPRPDSEATRSLAPSIQVGTDEIVLEKRKGGDGRCSEDAAEGSIEETHDEGYPHGFRLAAVVLALVLSIFLVSLDMVIWKKWI